MNFLKLVRKRIQTANREKSDADSEFVMLNDRTVFEHKDLKSWYRPVMFGPSTLASLAVGPASLRDTIRVIKSLEPDDYLRYLLAYYEVGIDRFGDSWAYADILTVLVATARLIRPRSYLEIGVRNGRSMAMVASICQTCEIVGIDLWTSNYADMSNPGPDFVRAEMTKLGHTGRLELISGDSHVVLPDFFSKHSDEYFDLITVDGDHTEKGAEQDLCDVLPRLKVGGVLVFDDISHPLHPYLADVWHQVLVADSRFLTWQFTELGYGVAFAIRVVQ